MVHRNPSLAFGQFRNQRVLQPDFRLRIDQGVVPLDLGDTHPLVEFSDENFVVELGGLRRSYCPPGRCRHPNRLPVPSGGIRLPEVAGFHECGGLFSVRMMAPSFWAGTPRTFRHLRRGEDRAENRCQKTGIMLFFSWLLVDCILVSRASGGTSSMHTAL